MNGTDLVVPDGRHGCANAITSRLCLKWDLLSAFPCRRACLIVVVVAMSVPVRAIVGIAFGRAIIVVIEQVLIIIFKSRWHHRHEHNGALFFLRRRTWERRLQAVPIPRSSSTNRQLPTSDDHHDHDHDDSCNAAHSWTWLRPSGKSLEAIDNAAPFPDDGRCGQEW